jgi:predicted deacylase
VDVPVIVVTGRAGGPRIALVAGVHGDEVEGPFALARLAETLAPERLAGTLMLVLCANPPAAEAGLRRAPQDDADLNRVFPGDAAGSLSHRLAASLFELVHQADLLMTLHSWYATGIVIPYVEYPMTGGEAAVSAERAARACGLERVMPLDWHPGLLPAAAVRSCIPAIEVELGGLGQVTPAGQATYRRTIHRVLRHAGALPTSSLPAPVVRTICGHHLTAPIGGLLRLDAAPGDAVVAGQRLGSVVGLDGRIETELVAPATGEIGAVRRFAPVREGDHVVALFETIDQTACP